MMTRALTGGCLCGAIRYELGTPDIWTRSRRPWTLMDASLDTHEGNRPA